MITDEEYKKFPENYWVEKRVKALPANKLRDFAYEIGLLKQGEDFGERRTSDNPFSPTVRMLRTFIVNFFKGKGYAKDTFDEDALIPYLCVSGSKVDEEYKKIFNKLKSFNDFTELVIAGKKFTELHKKQFGEIEKLNLGGKNEFRNKALSLAVLSSWAEAAGEPTYLLLTS